MLARFPARQQYPSPHLLIGAGHRTHMAMLAARRAYGGKIVVLMKPSLPRFLFDAVIVPWHDGLAEQANVLCTHGALNPMQMGQKRKGSVLVLVGGESHHGQWHNESMREAIHNVLNDEADYQLSDSRRTPAALSEALQNAYGEHFHPWQSCPAGWLREQLAVIDKVWVSEDSASMIYEALSAGCRVGVLPLASASPRSRVIKGLQPLRSEGWLSVYPAPIKEAPENAQPMFQEADRIAGVLQAQGFFHVTGSGDS
jgi:hypothetical protein